MQMYFNQYLSFFVKGTSVLLFGILNVTKTMDSIAFLILCVKHFVVLGAFVDNKRICIHFKSLCI